MPHFSRLFHKKQKVKNAPQIASHEHTPNLYLTTDGYDITKDGQGYAERNNIDTFNWFIEHTLVLMRACEVDYFDDFLTNSQYPLPQVTNSLPLIGPITQLSSYDPSEIKHAQRTRFTATFDISQSELESILKIKQFSNDPISGRTKNVTENTDKIKDFLRKHIVDIHVDMAVCDHNQATNQSVPAAWFRYKTVTNPSYNQLASKEHHKHHCGFHILK